MGPCSCADRNCVCAVRVVLLAGGFCSFRALAPVQAHCDVFLQNVKAVRVGFFLSHSRQDVGAREWWNDGNVETKPHLISILHRAGGCEGRGDLGCCCEGGGSAEPGNVTAATAAAPHASPLLSSPLLSSPLLSSPLLSSPLLSSPLLSSPLLSSPLLSSPLLSSPLLSSPLLSSPLLSSSLLPEDGVSPSRTPQPSLPALTPPSFLGALVAGETRAAETSLTLPCPACRSGTRWCPGGHRCTGVYSNRHRRWVRGCQDDVGSCHSQRRRSGCRQRRGRAAVDWGSRSPHSRAGCPDSHRGCHRGCHWGCHQF